MISDHLYSFMTSQSAITDIVSTRIYPAILPPQPTYPAITYRESDDDFSEDFTGITSPTVSSYFIDAWGDTYSDAVSLCAAIRSALNNQKGNFGGIHISKCIITSGPITIYEDAVEAYRQTQIFSISHKEV